MAEITRKKKLSASTSGIVRALGIFGGVQAIGILCSIIRTKLVAIWIGPVGVGLISIYNQVLEIFGTTTQLNLRQSAVRDISSCHDEKNIHRMLGIVRVLAVFLGVVGMLILLLASPLVGLISFGEDGHAEAFMFLSPVLLITAIASGEMAIMQGRGELKRLARATLCASVLASVVSVPLFYFLRVRGIVPVLIIFALCSGGFSLYFGRGFRYFGVGLKQALREGRPMLSLGAFMTLSTLVTTLSTYAFISWLNIRYSTDALGIYQAGYTIMNSYVGVIFTAISMEYYPRLSASCFSKWRTRTIVSHEISIVLWLLLPLGVAFVCCRSLIVEILYSKTFEVIVPYLAIGISGIFMRAAAWCLSFVMIARGDGKAYIVTETISAVLYLVLNIIGYTFWRYAGLGAAFVVWYTIYFIMVWAVYHFRYKLTVPRGILRLLLCGMAMCFATLAVSELLGCWLTLAIVFPPCAVLAYRRIKNNSPRARKEHTD